jgi:hypothetical protein
MNEKCRWELTRTITQQWYTDDKYIYRACNNNFLCLLDYFRELDYKYCSYCGKEIEEIEE